MPKIIKEMKEEIKYEIIGICILAIALFSLVSLVSTSTGSLGAFVTRVFTSLFGKVAFVVPVVMVICGLALMVKRKPIYITQRGIGFLLAFCSMAALLHTKVPLGQEFLLTYLSSYGGYLGALEIKVLRLFFGITGSYIFIGTLGIVAGLLITDNSLVEGVFRLKSRVKEQVDLAKERFQVQEAPLYDEEAAEEEEEYFPTNQVPRKNPLFLASELVDDKPERESSRVVNIADALERKQIKTEGENPQQVEGNGSTVSTEAGTTYQLPPMSLLKKPHKLKSGKPSKEISENSMILEQTLESFGVSAKVVEVSQGPAITRYELQPAPGVKVSRIVNLADDIALKLAATGVRIEAPIPGKAAVGIEVPNKDVSAVALRDVLESPEFQQAPSKLTVALGRDIAGSAIIADLGKMPHLLVAGATGSGKSVCVNTLILSILFKATPDEVKFLLIDPKVVELSTFNGIPHLMAPVVTDPKKAASSLRWAVHEMEKRYQQFAAAGVREIKRYNEVCAGDAKIPYIIVIIDELADLMMVAPVDVEDAICRLAQMARAAGIHLVLATQRPSVDVITGIIKANIPSRISFAVSSQVDSRTILDMAGAEKLLGKGDMLFYPVGSPKPQRVQGAFVSDTEVEEVVSYTKRQAEPEFEEDVFSAEIEAPNSDSCQDEDELLDDAIRLVLESGQASISMLQRRFRIGYSRAARLIDMMEQLRIVGPNIGSKAREIIATAETLQGRLQKNK